MDYLTGTVGDVIKELDSSDKEWRENLQNSWNNAERVRGVALDHDRVYYVEEADRDKRKSASVVYME